MKNEPELLRRLASTLAIFLAKDQASKSIYLQLGKDWAREWAAICTAANIPAYASVQETEDHLLKLFGFLAKKER